MAWQYVMAWYFVFLNACIVSFSFGSIVTLISFTKDIGVNLNTLNENVKDKATRSQTKEQLFALIRFHASARQLSEFGRQFGNYNIIDFILNFSADWVTIIRP